MNDLNDRPDTVAATAKDPMAPAPRLGEPPTISGLAAVSRLACASFFFSLAAIGLILPGLPTTPFLLLSSFFLARSFPSLNERLLRSRLFGPILTDWQVRGGIRRHVKFKATSFVVVAVGVSLYFNSLGIQWKLIVGGLAAAGIVVIWRLPEVKT